MATPYSITHICTIENGDLNAIAVAPVQEGEEVAYLAGLEDDSYIYLYNIDSGTNINGSFIPHIESEDGSFYGIAADGNGNWYFSTGDNDADQHSIQTFTGTGDPGVYFQYAVETPGGGLARGWQLGWSPQDDRLWGVSQSLDPEQIAFITESGWTVVYDDAWSSATGFTNPWSPIPSTLPGLPFFLASNSGYGFRWTGTLYGVEMPSETYFSQNRPAFARDVALYPINVGTGLDPETAWYEFDGESYSLATYMSDAGIQAGPSTYSYDLRYTFIVESGTGKVWQIDWLGAPPLEPTIVGFINKCVSTTTSLFSGAKLVAAETDGPVLTARFGDLSDITTVKDGVQRRVNAEGNLFYVVDGARLKMIHRCGLEISGLDISDPQLFNCPVLVGTLSDYIQSAALYPDGSILYVRFVNSDGIYTYSFPAMTPLGTWLSSGTLNDGDQVLQLSMRSDGRLFYLWATPTAYEIRSGATPSTHYVNSNVSDWDTFCYSNFDDMLYYLDSDGSTHSIYQVNPDTGDDVALATNQFGGFGFDMAPVVTPDGAVWWCATATNSGGRIYRYDAALSTISTIEVARYTRQVIPLSNSHVWTSIGLSPTGIEIMPDLSFETESCMTQFTSAGVRAVSYTPDYKQLGFASPFTQDYWSIDNRS